jgi:hypothetical protein
MAVTFPRPAGDEWNNREEDMAGYTVMRVDTGAPGQMKKIVYAGGVDASGELVPTQYEVGKASPQALGLQPGITGKGIATYCTALCPHYIQGNNGHKQCTFCPCVEMPNDTFVAAASEPHH